MVKLVNGDGMEMVVMVYGVRDGMDDGWNGWSDGNDGEGYGNPLLAPSLKRCI